MITTWRIVKAEYAGTAFDGKSASIAGGRWNSRGTPLVYTASTASLAALELLVHITRRNELPEFVLFACQINDGFVEALAPDILPAGWKRVPPPPLLKAIGDRWVAAGSSAVLRVPSVIIETEFNYLLNPGHPDFAEIQNADPVPFSLDMRLIRR